MIATAPPLPSSSATVLIVDGEILVRLALADYLRDCGYKVIEAATGVEAVIVLQQPDAAITAVLSDVELPGDLDGFGLATWIRQYSPGLPVILFGTHKRAAEATGDLCEKGPHLAKPYDHLLVVTRIRKLLAERDASQGG